jgi:diacylglycerol kinase (ATP)
MEKIGIIVNFNSRRNKNARRDPVELFKKKGGDTVIVKPTFSLDDIYNVAEEFKKEGVSYFATSGGDGTIHHVLSRFIHVYGETNVPPLLILKGGTMNNISKTIQIEGNGSDILKRAVKKLRNGEQLQLYRRDTIKINDLYCFLFGNGITADFLKELYDNGKSYTKIFHLIYQCVTEALGLRKQSCLLKGVDGVVTIDGNILPYTHFLGILAGTVEDVGMGFSPLSGANSIDGYFHIIANGMNPSAAVLQIHRLKRGLPMKHTMNYDGLARELRLEMYQPFTYTMDGDLYQSDGILEVSAGPQVRLARV